MRLFKRLKGLPANEKGNVLILTAAAMPLLVGSAGLAIDTIELSLVKRQLQRAADTAALAGAYAKAQSKPVPGAVTNALAHYNSIARSATAIEEPATGTYPNRSVRVQLSAQRTVPFMAFFTNTRPTISAEATAALVYSGQYCMIALETGDVTGITFSGSNTSRLGCGVISNSRHSRSVVADGSSSVTASPIAGVGGVPSSTGYAQPALLLPYSQPQEDPFANVPVPAPNCSGASELRVLPNTTVPATPGCYKGWDIKGTLNLAPGTYYIDGKGSGGGVNAVNSLSVDSTATISGTGVTIVLTSSTPTDPASFPTVHINGSAQVNLSAPVAGSGQPYPGILFYQDRRAGTTGTNFLNGNSLSSYEGAFYFPRQQVTFNGNTGMQTKCVQMVARLLVLTGNSAISNQCDTAGGARGFDATWVRLVA
ncbi:MAG TPA: pilus assembly protein TadG-related protein [Allosphingosinicella sp.]|nr:pilus assembly protein TadG-related protein [Allosphingosinicella sp.]